MSWRSRTRRLVFVVGLLIAAAIMLIPFSRSYPALPETGKYDQYGQLIGHAAYSVSCGPPVTSFMNSNNGVTADGCRGGARTRMAIGGIAALGTLFLAFGLGSLISDDSDDENDERTEDRNQSAPTGQPHLSGDNLRRQAQSDSRPVAIGIAEEIRQLAQLRDEGLLTDGEFAAQKARLLIH